MQGFTVFRGKRGIVGEVNYRTGDGERRKVLGREVRGLGHPWCNDEEVMCTQYAPAES